MKILIVATKEPWPPVDGGRLAVLSTMRALADHGHELALVCPLLGTADRSAVETALASICRPILVDTRLGGLFAAVRSACGRRPFTVVRHTLPRVAAAVEMAVSELRPDVVFAEHLQALPQTEAAECAGIPVVLRQHNVESLLWSFAAGFRGPVVRTLMQLEARRVAAWEARALHEVAATVTLSVNDGMHLSALAGAGARVEHVPLPFPAELPAAEHALPGAPAVVFLASRGWRPNRDAADRFIGQWWPVVAKRIPSAELHVFGVEAAPGEVKRVHVHPPPADSRQAFPEGAIAALPARHPTGVPLKAMEAWARGLPVVTTVEAAAALGARDANHLLTATDPDGFASAVAKLAGDPDLTTRLVRTARHRLRSEHGAAMIAARLSEIFESVV